MAMYFIDSFDHYTTLSQKWAVATSGATISPLAARNGPNGLRMLKTNTLTQAVPPADKYTVGIARRGLGTSGAQGFKIRFRDLSNATDQVQLVCEDNTIRFVTGNGAGTTIVPAMPAWSDGLAWHYVEVEVLVANAGGTVRVQIDGVPRPEFNFTGDTQASSAARIEQIIIDTGIGLGFSDDNYFDDVYISNGLSPYRQFYGDQQMIYLAPDSAGSVTQLTPSGLSTNWQNVAESPPDTANFNFSGTAGFYDLYRLSDISVSLVGTVSALQLSSFVSKSDVGARSAQNLILTDAGTGSGNLFESAILPLSTSYTYNVTMWGTNPSTLSGWTPAEVNNLQSGVKVV